MNALHTARGPRELGQAILQSIIGHCALFAQEPRPFLHRGISEGNILLIDNPFEMEIPTLLQDLVSDRRCTAVICDGDVAKYWGDTREPPSPHRSGTKPFISERVAGLWTVKKDVLHTPIDDLESHAWLMLFTVLRRFAERAPKELTTEMRWWRGLNSDDLNKLPSAKFEIMSRFKDEWWIEHWISSELVKTFQPLLASWFEYAQHYSRALSKIILAEYTSADARYEAIEVLSKAAYRSYVEEGVAHVPLLPEDWPLEV